MDKPLRKEEILNQLLGNAAQRWAAAEVNRLKPDLELAAELILTVEEFTVTPENEPAHPTIVLHQVEQRKRDA